MTVTNESPPPTTTGSRATRVLGAIALAGVALTAVLGLVTSPPDVVQGDSVRLFYVHVPAVITMYFGVLACSLASAMWLRKRTDGWDALAVAGAELATLFTGLGLVTGMLWGRVTWGVYWVWDARLTSTALLFLLLLGYLALRRYPAAPDVRSRLSSVVGLLLLPNALIVHYAVDWWRSLHQDSTLAKVDPTIEGEHLSTFFVALVTTWVIFVWLLIHRFRVAWLEQRAESRSLDAAIEERLRDDDVTGALQ